MKYRFVLVAISVVAALFVALPAVASAPATDLMSSRRHGGFDARQMLDRLEQVGRFTPIPEASGEGRRVVYSNGGQRVWLVDGDEQLVATYLVSGRRGVPAIGTYSVYSRSEWSGSYGGGLKMQHMVRFAVGTNRGWAIGFHAIPITHAGSPIQSESELGQFRSAGCVRQAPADAALMWDFAGTSTPVVVIP